MNSKACKRASFGQIVLLSIKVVVICHDGKGCIVAVDKAYNDYEWYNQLSDKGIFFVTRRKAMQYRVAERGGVIKSKALHQNKL